MTDRIYVNEAAVNGGTHDIALNLSYKLEGEDPILVAPVVMTREFASVLIELLKREISK